MPDPEDGPNPTSNMAAAIKNLPSVYFGPYLVTPQVPSLPILLNQPTH
jgi:hypothetical protein